MQVVHKFYRGNLAFRERNFVTAMDLDSLDQIASL